MPFGMRPLTATPSPPGGAALTSCPECQGCFRAGTTGHANCTGCSCFPSDGSSYVVANDVRWLPYSARNQCYTNDQSGTIVCTRQAGHPGDHAGHSERGTRMIFRWRQERSSTDPEQRACRECGERRPMCANDSCAGNNRCVNCCSCTQVPFREQQRGTFIGEPSARYPRYAGIEIECGKLSGAKNRGWGNVAKVADKYQFRVGTDGSITNFQKSTEISTTPARGDVLDLQLKEVGEALIKDEIKANSSCGLHVHIDVRDYTIEHLMNFVYVWSRLENAMYRLVAHSRRNVNYSKPWGSKFLDSGCLDMRKSMADREKLLDEAIYGSQATARSYKSSRSKHDSRYHGMNLNAIYVHGTIEFRLHHGTVNPTKIRMWTAVCEAIVQFCYGKTEQEVRAIRGSNTEFLEKIIGDEEVIAWTRARRLLFANMNRQHHGLVPLAKPVKPSTGSSASRRIPVVDPGEVEMSESNSSQTGM